MQNQKSWTELTPDDVQLGIRRKIVHWRKCNLKKTVNVPMNNRDRFHAGIQNFFSGRKEGVRGMFEFFKCRVVVVGVGSEAFY